ncbi:MAG: CPBP family intramembrane metalloprotease [Actinomycetota bacterium]|nr:CPBP family intramembrane metalloprotease [Actinomycetota bacterium]
MRPDPPAPRRGWAIRLFLVAEAVFLAVSALVGWLIGLDDAGGILAAIAVPSVAAAVVAVLLTAWLGNGPRIDLGLRWSWDDVAVGLITGLGGLLLTVPAALVYAWVVGPEGMSTAVGDVFGGVRTTWPVALAVMAVVVLVAPLCEEILYRGLLWRAVEKHVRNQWVVYLLTTLVFAFAHFELTRTPLLFVVALPLGLARVLTGRLTASVIAHQINNFLPGMALALMLTGVVPSV